MFPKVVATGFPPGCSVQSWGKGLLAVLFRFLGDPINLFQGRDAVAYFLDSVHVKGVHALLDGQFPQVL